LNPARITPERSNGFSIPGPDILSDGISDIWPKPSPACPAEQAETAQFPVRIAPLIGQKETVRRQMQNARRAASLDARFQRLFAQQRLHAEHTCNALPFHSRPRQLSELV
jgi:hypothetical protein